MRTSFAVLCIANGCLFLILTSYFIYQRYDSSRLSFRIKETKYWETHQASGKVPAVLKIPSLALILPIIPTKIDNYKWEATNEGISYLVSSALPGDLGNSVMYGHNWPTLLGRLPQIKNGDPIEVLFSDGSVRSFAVKFTSVVTPDQTHVIQPTDDSRMTIYTCTGFMDSKRFVVTAL